MWGENQTTRSPTKGLGFLPPPSGNDLEKGGDPQQDSIATSSYEDELEEFHIIKGHTQINQDLES